MSVVNKATENAIKLLVKEGSKIKSHK